MAHLEVLHEEVKTEQVEGDGGVKERETER